MQPIIKSGFPAFEGSEVLVRLKPFRCSYVFVTAH